MASLLVHPAVAGPAAAQPEPRPPGSSVVAGSAEARYLVRFVDGTDVAARARSLRADGLIVGRRFSHVMSGLVLTARPGQMRRVARMRGVSGTALDGQVHTSETWGVDRIDQRALPLDGRFESAGGGEGVLVYVVDTGLRSDHQEFTGRVAPGWSALPDGTEDCNGHGTHVAGTALGSTSGVARTATAVPVRVLGCDGEGPVSALIAGLDWIARQHVPGTPAVVNLSVEAEANSILDVAVQSVVNDGLVVVTAAGNWDTDACESSPARVPAALTVGATDRADAEAWFSSHGSCVDLYAPGVDIASAWHTSTTATSSQTGTSMASPHAAGAAAVVLGLAPSATPAEVTGALTGASTSGVIRALGPGSPNRLLYVGRDALATTPPATVMVPAPAQRVRARAGARSAVVRWVRGDTRGARITGQTVRVIRHGNTVARWRVAAAATR